MIKVVLDTNVLVSGLISRNGPPGQILDAWTAGRFQTCFSPQILDELQRVLHYPRIRQRLTAILVNSILEMISNNGEWVKGTVRVNVLTRDPSDNMYLACAMEAKADYLVTGNADPFAEAGAKYQGIIIVSPRTFLDIIRTG